MNKILGLKKANCRNCHKCIRECPVKSINFSDQQANIIPEECILCGRCVVACPQNAKDVRNDVHIARELIRSGRKVIASVAPSFIVDFDVADIHGLETCLKQLGFAGAAETAEGAYIVKTKYEELVAARTQDVIISTCCHSTVLLAQKYFPETVKYLAHVLSPMQAHAKLIKSKEPDAAVVFIGPCISKKDEADQYPGIVDCVLTFEELREWMAEENVAPQLADDAAPSVRMSRFFPQTGGIIKSMHTENTGFQYLSVDGVKDCISALHNIASGKLKNCFVEMSICRGSCINGPMVRRYRDEMLGCTIKLEEFAKPQTADGADDFNITADFDLQKPITEKMLAQVNPSEEVINAILAKMGKTRKEDELNCGTCGYPTCREKAVAVYQGKAEPSMCLPFMMEKAESFSDKIISVTPNAIMVFDEQLNVQQMNAAAKKIFNLASSLQVKNMPVMEILEPEPYVEMLSEDKRHMERRKYLAEYDKYIEETIQYDKEHEIIISIMKDVTDEQREALHAKEVQQKTIDITDKVIEKQMRVVQEIASLLGETTAETKIALTNLKDVISVEDKPHE